MDARATHRHDGLAARNSLIAGSRTLAMKERALSLRRGGVDVIDLTSGELAVEPMGAVRDGAREAISRGPAASTSTLGLFDLRREIAALVTARTGIGWSADEIGLTAGAKQALFNLISVMIDPGDGVIIPQPYWTSFPDQVVIAGGKPVFVATAHRNFRLDATDVAAAITPATRVVLVNSPNNPTGAVCDPETLVAFGRLAADRNIWIILDEVYGDYVFPPHRRDYPFARAPQMRARLVLVNSFSKSLALPGWRLGYFAAPPAVVGAVEALQSHVTSNPNAVAQYGVLAGLRAGLSAYQQGILQDLATRRAFGLDLMSSLPGVRTITPEGGFFLYADISDLVGRRLAGRAVATSDDLAELLLEHAGVVVIPGSAFGDDAGMRISMCVEDAAFRTGLVRLTDALRSVGGQAQSRAGRVDCPEPSDAGAT